MSDLEDLYSEFFDKSDESVKLLPEAVEFLNLCERAGLRIFLLSSIKNDHFKRQSEHLNLTEYFERVYTEALDKRICIKDLIRDCCLDVKETVFVGDMKHDVDAGRSAGVFTAAVLGGYNSKEMLVESAPDLLIDNLLQLSDYLYRK